MSRLLFFLIISKSIGIISGLLYYKRLSKPLRLIWLFIILSLASEYAGHIIAVWYHKNNLWLTNIYYLVGFLTLIMASRDLMEKKYQKIINAGTILIVLVWIINVSHFGMNYFSTWAFLLIDVALIIQYLYILLNTVITEERILKSPIFWVSLPIILFFGCNIPIVGYFNYLADHDTALLAQLFNIIIILNYICFPMFAIGFYLQGRKTITPSKRYVYK